MIPAHVYERTVLTFLEPVVALLADPSVSEVMVNGPSEIFIEKRGKLFRTDKCFSTPQALMSALRHIAQYAGKPLDAEHPILEARLPDGSRVEAVLPPAAPLGPVVAIRRFHRHGLSVEKLLQLGSLTREAADLLSALVECKQNVIVAGGTGSGKTSLLNVLSSLIPEDERVVVIEDARELQLQREHVVPLEARPPDARGRGQVTIRQLFKASLRLRPDRIVVGEIRGGEALDLVQAMTSGHGGCLSTVHATYPKDALNRLETMALMSDVELPLCALRQQIASAIDIIVQTARLRDGSRCITHITEVGGCDPNASVGPGADASARSNGHDLPALPLTHLSTDRPPDQLTQQSTYQLTDLFVRRYIRKAGADTPRFELCPTGAIPRCAEMMGSMGRDLPKSTVMPAGDPS